MAAPRVERGRLAFDGQFWGLSNRWSPSLLTAPFAGAALFGLRALLPGLYNALVWVLAKFSEWPETCFALALAVFALLAWRRVDAGQ